jgi:hypothetical protein
MLVLAVLPSGVRAENCILQGLVEAGVDTRRGGLERRKLQVSWDLTVNQRSPDQRAQKDGVGD